MHPIPDDSAILAHRAGLDRAQKLFPADIAEAVRAAAFSRAELGGDLAPVVEPFRPAAVA